MRVSTGSEAMAASKTSLASGDQLRLEGARAGVGETASISVPSGRMKKSASNNALQTSWTSQVAPA